MFLQRRLSMSAVEVGFPPRGAHPRAESKQASHASLAADQNLISSHISPKNFCVLSHTSPATQPA